MKGAKREMEILLMAFLKEILFRAIWSFWNKNGMVSLSILHNKRDQEVHENFICCFWKNLICSYLIFSGHFLTFDWVWSQLSQATATIEYLKSQDMIKILKQSGHDFPGKRLCGGYYT